MRDKYSTSSLLADMSWLKHGFFHRTGGVSDGIFKSLNIGYSSGDDYVNVDENRRIVCRALDLQDGWIVNCNQIHSTRILEVSRNWGDDTPDGDGMVTVSPQIGLAVSSADCAPVLIANDIDRIVGAAHVGWRGAIEGTCEALIEAMVSLGATRNRLIVAIGPCIQQSSYEVATDFFEKFLAQDADSEAFFRRDASSLALHFDLPHYIQHRLASAGVCQVDVSTQDTYSQPDKFFSARRALHQAEPAYGRMLSVIYIK